MKHTTRPLALLTLLAAFSSCLGDDERQRDTQKPPPPPAQVADSSLEDFTGARTKVVWSQPTNPDKSDKHGTSRHHHLFGIDSADGRGPRKILPDEGNYAYPIITPDGERIVFTRKIKVTKGKLRSFTPEIEVVNFDGTGLRKVRKGYAQEVWEDPDTGRYWVYAGEDFKFVGGTAPICRRIIRFPLDAPDAAETVWDRTEMGTDSFAISGDAKRFAGLFPWPQAGLGNLETNDWETTTNGCWVSMAPDNSYRSWVFDGPHRNLFMFDASGNQTATIPINDHPWIQGKEVYHPKWTNHPRFLTMTGPHVSGKQKGRGKKVEVFLGKFSPEFDRVEAWLRVTNNSMPDIYPDAWIEGGASSASPTQPAPTQTADTTPSTRNSWPSNPDGLVFKWQDVRSKNEFTAPDGSNQVSRAEPKRGARYSRHYELALDGGSATEEILERPPFAQQALAGDALSLQFVITPNSPSGTIIGPAPLVELDGGTLKFHSGKIAASAPDHPLPAGEPTHVAISSGPDGAQIYLDGTPVDTRHSSAPWTVIPQAPLEFGTDLDATLGHIALYNRPLTAEEVARDFALVAQKLDAREPVERLELDAKLVGAFPLPTLESIEPYVRALAYYTYETDHPDYPEIAVAHWAILDRTPVPGFPREAGKTYKLTVEPFDAHPQLQSQASNRDQADIGFQHMLFYDVTTPQL